MLRPGPLQEWPLERFLPPDPNINVSPLPSAPPPFKQPHTPGAPSTYSPAKKRIFHEEGLLDLGAKPNSPLLSTSGKHPSSYFHYLLQGPDSPVKKLDFSAPIGQDGDAGSDGLGEPVLPLAKSASPLVPPRRATHASSVWRSTTRTPKSKSSSSSTPRSMPEHVDDCFSPRGRAINKTPLTSSTSLPALPSSSQRCCDVAISRDGGGDYAEGTQSPIVSASPGAKHGPYGLSEVDKENIPPIPRMSNSTTSSTTLTYTPPLKKGKLRSDEPWNDLASGSQGSGQQTPRRSKRISELARSDCKTALPRVLSLPAVSSTRKKTRALTTSRSSTGRLEQSNQLPVQVKAGLEV